MKTTIIILTILLYSFTAQAGDWTRKDTYFEAAALATIALDYSQTKGMVSKGFMIDGRPYEEHNPIMGSRPSSQTVDLYFASVAVAHVAVAYLLPQKWRRWFQAGTIVLELGVVAGNYSAGLGFGF